MSTTESSHLTGSPTYLRRASARTGISRLCVFLITSTWAVLTVFPLLWMVSSAFKDGGEAFSPDLVPRAPTMQNFVSVFTDAPFLRYLLNTFVVAVVVTVVALWFHSMAAYALARLRFPGRDKIFFFIFATLLIAVPSVIVPLFVLVKSLGMINNYAGLIIPPVFSAFGIFLLRQFYLGLPSDLEDAAHVDGCGYWRIYWHVALPLSRPLLAALAVFFFLANWNSFLWPLTVTTDQDLWLIQVGLASFQGENSAAWSVIMAGATVAAIPTTVLFFIFQRQLVESIKITGTRG